MTFGWWTGFGAWCYFLARSGMYGKHTIRLVDTAVVKHTDIAVDDLLIVTRVAYKTQLLNSKTYYICPVEIEHVQYKQ